MSTPVETGFMDTLLRWAWAAVGVLMGIIWKKHNEEIASIKGGIKEVGMNMGERIELVEKRVGDVERGYVRNDTYERNRQEMRDGQINIFARLDKIGQAIARIEGKLDK